jgi:hypothetical protein
MTREDFIATMKMIDAYYLDWKFDFSDRIQVETWYQILSDAMDFTTLKKVVNLWITRNDTGPNSPRDLRKIQAELKLKAMINEGENTQ